MHTDVPTSSDQAQRLWSRRCGIFAGARTQARTRVPVVEDSREVNVFKMIGDDGSANALAAGAGTEAFACEDVLSFAPVIRVGECGGTFCSSFGVSMAYAMQKRSCKTSFAGRRVMDLPGHVLRLHFDAKQARSAPKCTYGFWRRCGWLTCRLEIEGRVARVGDQGRGDTRTKIKDAQMG